MYTLIWLAKAGSLAVSMFCYSVQNSRKSKFARADFLAFDHHVQCIVILMQEIQFQFQEFMMTSIRSQPNYFLSLRSFRIIMVTVCPTLVGIGAVSTPRPLYKDLAEYMWFTNLIHLANIHISYELSRLAFLET